MTSKSMNGYIGCIYVYVYIYIYIYCILYLFLVSCPANPLSFSRVSKIAAGRYGIARGLDFNLWEVVEDSFFVFAEV